jgi:hypothetical protein
VSMEASLRRHRLWRGAYMAARQTGATGLEPATSGVTGRRSNQLSYAPRRAKGEDSGGLRNSRGRWMFERMDEPLRISLTEGEARSMKARKARIVVGLLAMAMSLAAAAVAMAGTFIGTDAPERLVGTPLSDTMDSKGGNDRVFGRGGDDQIDLGWGRDRGHGGRGNDTIAGGDGPDRIHGGADNDTLDGQMGRDRLWGGPGEDTLLGHAGGDLLVGGPGNDNIQGDVPNAGDLVSRDRIFGGQGDDQLQGGDGPDLIIGGDGNDTSIGNAGRDRMFGGGGNDTQDGRFGNDRIFANAGQDISYGGEGNDDLWALMRADVTPGPNGEVDTNGDTLDGGPGNDRFHTRDGEVDHITCGDGFDVAQLDTVDVVNDPGSCERVVRRAPRPNEGVEPNGQREPKEPKDS